MGLQKDNKQVYQEYRYIKIPDRRLISGFLHINVVNHNANDAQNDFNQSVHESNSSGSLNNQIKYSDTFTGDDNSSGNIVPDFHGTQDRGRDEMKHSFADYDCFVFHVAGGMSLSGGVSLPESGATLYNGAAALKTAGFVSGTGTGLDPYVWIDNSQALNTAELTSRWWEHSDSSSNPIGDYCSHFVKYHLISRINNASGHGLNQQAHSRPLYTKHRPIQRQTYTHDNIGNRLDPALVTNEYILSHGIYDTTNSIGEDLGMRSYATLGEGRSSGTNNGFTKIETVADRSAGESQASGGAITNHDGNTYFSPVDKISIYGKHKLTFDRHTNIGGDKIYSHEGKNSVHVQDFWDLVIDIGLRGNHPYSTSSPFGTPNKSLLRPQINVMFQPFGETAEFDVSESQHT